MVGEVHRRGGVPRRRGAHLRASGGPISHIQPYLAISVRFLLIFVVLLAVWPLLGLCPPGTLWHSLGHPGTSPGLPPLRPYLRCLGPDTLELEGQLCPKVA